MKKIFLPILFSIYIFIAAAMPAFVYAADDGVDFISTPLWISHASPKENDTVTLYAALFNKNSAAIKTTVSFYDGSVIIGSRSATIAAAETVTFSIPTRISAGEHAFHAVIQKAILPDGHDIAQASLGEANVELPKIFVPKTVLTAQASDASNASDAASPLGSIDTLQDKVTSFVPDPVKNALTGLFSTVDSGRSGASDALSKTSEALHHEADIKKLKDAGVMQKTPEEITREKADSLNPGSVFVRAVKTPWQYMRLTIIDILVFIFKNKYIFYPLCALILFFIGRFIWRRVRRE